MKPDRILHYRIEAHLVEDRIGFEIVLPWDVTWIDGLYLSARPGGVNLANVGDRGELAGLLTLTWQAPGHVFFQGPVFSPTRLEANYKPLGLTPPDSFIGGGFSHQAPRIEPIGLAVPGHLRTLEGYYIDVINRLGGNDEFYPIDLFFQYQTSNS